MFTQNYCSTHGKKLDEQKKCEYCKNPKGTYWQDILNKDALQPPWYERDYYKKYFEWSVFDCGEYESDDYYCDTCKYFMYHGSAFCPSCGGKMEQRKISYNEKKRLYGDYKSGY